jgi:DNA-binding NarL/FixJ family response regulator
VTGRLPIDYREQLDAIASLPGSWYAAQEIPAKLIRDLGRAPHLEEWEIGKQRQRLIGRCVADVIACAANGMSEKSTAIHLTKSRHTVKTQRQQGLTVLKARSMTQAVATAIRLGIIVWR